MESFNYDKCGFIDFKSQANLKMHQKGTYCKASCERIVRPPNTLSLKMLMFWSLWNSSNHLLIIVIQWKSIQIVRVKNHLIQLLFFYIIISCKNGKRLLKCVINNLTFKVLFRKSFRLDEVRIKSTTDCENSMLPCILKKTDG